MAKGQTVADLKIKLSAIGLKDVEILRRELKSIDVASKLSEKGLQGIIGTIKTFGEATKKTTVGLKGQIAAFEKLRDRAAFQGKAYRDLTREIVNMNKALANRLKIESEIGRTGKGDVRQPGADVTAGLLGSKYFTDSGRRKEGSQAEFSERIAKLQMLMYARSWSDLEERQQKFLEGITTTKQGYLDQRRLKGSGFSSEELMADKATALSYWAAKGQYTGEPISPKYDMSKFTQKTGQLNDLQLKALSLLKALMGFL